MRLFKYLNISLKLLLLGCLMHSVLFADLPQYQMKGMHWRLVFYPLVVGLPAAVYVALRLKSKKVAVYPHHIDALISLCAATDMLGNTLNLYNSVFWWDDFMHLFNTTPWILVAGFVLIQRTKLSAWVIAALTVGYGILCHIIWEIDEYITFVPNNPNEYLMAYKDTIGDLSLALVGTIAAGIMTYYITKKDTLKFLKWY